jgi:hypothetical protein
MRWPDDWFLLVLAIVVALFVAWMVGGISSRLRPLFF